MSSDDDNLQDMEGLGCVHEYKTAIIWRFCTWASCFFGGEYVVAAIQADLSASLTTLGFSRMLQSYQPQISSSRWAVFEADIWEWQDYNAWDRMWSNVIIVGNLAFFFFIYARHCFLTSPFVEELQHAWKNIPCGEVEVGIICWRNLFLPALASHIILASHYTHISISYLIAFTPSF